MVPAHELTFSNLLSTILSPKVSIITRVSAERDEGRFIPVKTFGIPTHNLSSLVVSYLWQKGCVLDRIVTFIPISYLLIDFEYSEELIEVLANTPDMFKDGLGKYDVAEMLRAFTFLS